MESTKTKAQVPIRNRGDNQCPHHNAEVILACTDCGGELVCSQCITSRHHRHGFENISKVSEEKKNNIQKYIQNVEKTQLPTITNNLQSIDHQIKENTNHFKNLEQKITLQGEKMKKDIDKITKQLTERCREIEKQNFELLSKYKNDLDSIYTQLNQTLAECKDTLKTANTILLIDTERDTRQDLKLPNPPKCTTLEFTAGTKSSKHLQDDFGSLSVMEGKMLVPQESPHHTLKSDVVKQYKENDSTVVSEFIHTTNIRSVEKSTSDSVWLSYNDDKSISHVTLQGEIKQKLEVGSDVRDISVSPVTGNLWLCCCDDAVYEVSGDKPTKRFTTDYWPWYLCMTPDDNVVMSNIYGNVTVYSTTGQVLHSTQKSDSIEYPHHVTVCTSTGDIAVCGYDWLGRGGKGKQHVSVFNSKLHLKYKYYGSPVSVMKSDFYPIDVVYDTQGHLLIADYYNKCIQLVSGEGQFLTVVHTDTLQPKALTLIQDGLLCVVFDDKKVKVIRYSV